MVHQNSLYHTRMHTNQKINGRWTKAVRKICAQNVSENTSETLHKTCSGLATESILPKSNPKK